MAKAYDTRWQSKKATASAVEKFEAQFAKDMGVSLTDFSDDYEVVTTGSLNLDSALTIGGIPTGRIGEIWGPEHAGKTTACILMAREFQRAYPDKKVAWVDMEQTFDPKWATSLGLDVKAMWRPTVKTAEDVADSVKRLVESGLCSLVILDSVGGMIARMEYQKESDEATVGLVPKIVTRMVKQVSPMAKSNGTAVIVVNQVRAQIGGYGPDETTGGGWALKHVTSWRLQVKRGSVPHTVTRDGKQVPVGHEMAIKVQKNKMGPYGQVASVWLHNVETDKYGPVGVDLIQETYDHAKRQRLFGDKGGGYHTMPDGSEIRGEEKVIEALRENEAWVEELRGKVLASLSGKISEETEVGSEDESEDFAKAMK